MELIGKLASNDTSNLGMLSSASKYVAIKFEDQCIHMINNKEIWNGLKGNFFKKEIITIQIIITYIKCSK